jgi:hypothetical protein
MNSFERQAFLPPPPSPFHVLAYYGSQGKFKVRAYGKNRIMTRDEVIKYARSTKAVGGIVNLAGFITPSELGE